MRHLTEAGMAARSAGDAALRRKLQSAATAAQRRLLVNPERLPRFWDVRLKAFVRAEPQGRLCVYERQRRKRGALLVASLPGDWFAVDPRTLPQSDYELRYS